MSYICPQTALKSLAYHAGSTFIVGQLDTQSYDASRFFLKEKMYIQCFSFIGPAQPRSTAAAAVNGASVSSPTPSPSPPPIGSPSPSPLPPGSFEVRHVTTDDGELTPDGEELLRAAEPVHRQLRPALKEGTENYIAIMKKIFAQGGRMLVAIEHRSSFGQPMVSLGCTVYRYYNDFSTGDLRNWVDDLVTDSVKRSSGVGRAILDVIRSETRRLKVEYVQLDSGVYRKDAHRFYFREGFIIHAYSLAINIVQQ